MRRMIGRWSVASVIAIGLGGVGGRAAQAQYYWGNGWGGGYGGYGGYGGFGGTVGGDVARGMGYYAAGLGRGREQTAEARSINTDTWMRYNQFVYRSAVEAERNRRAYAIANNRRDAGAYNAIRERIARNPDRHDIEVGDALNFVLGQLTAPKLRGRTLKDGGLKIPQDEALRIPFRYASSPMALSAEKLVTDAEWPKALRRDGLVDERKAVEKALADANASARESIDDAIPPAQVKSVFDAVGRLRSAFNKDVPADDPGRADGERFLKILSGFTQLIQTPDSSEIDAAYKGHPRATVSDLVHFMEAFNLRFGPAETDAQKALYAGLYPILAQQRDALFAQAGGPPPDAEPPATDPAAAGSIFHGLPADKGDGSPPDRF